MRAAFGKLWWPERVQPSLYSDSSLLGRRRESLDRSWRGRCSGAGRRCLLLGLWQLRVGAPPRRHALYWRFQPLERSIPPRRFLCHISVPLEGHCDARRPLNTLRHAKYRDGRSLERLTRADARHSWKPEGHVALSEVRMYLACSNVRCGASRGEESGTMFLSRFANARWRRDAYDE